MFVSVQILPECCSSISRQRCVSLQSSKLNSTAAMAATSHTTETPAVDERTTRVYERILNFLRDPSQLEYHFESGLSRAERLRVHQIAEGFGLFHRTVDPETANRHVVLCKLTDDIFKSTNRVLTIPLIK